MSVLARILCIAAVAATFGATAAVAQAPTIVPIEQIGADHDSEGTLSLTARFASAVTQSSRQLVEWRLTGEPCPAGADPVTPTTIVSAPVRGDAAIGVRVDGVTLATSSSSRFVSADRRDVTVVVTDPRLADREYRCLAAVARLDAMSEELRLDLAEGVPDPEQPPAPAEETPVTGSSGPALSVKDARSLVRRTLQRRAGSRFAGRRRYSSACTYATNSRVRCTIRWTKGKARYRATVTVARVRVDGRVRTRTSATVRRLQG